MAKQFQGISSIATPDTASIKQSLLQTMVMGLPTADAQKPTFYFDRVVDYAKHDEEGSPWDWTATPTSETAATSKQVICAYEFFSPLGRQGSFVTEVGEFNPTSLIVTMFEEEWEEVAGFSYVTVGASDQKWFFRFWRPTYAISDMAVYQVHCQADRAT